MMSSISKYSSSSPRAEARRDAAVARRLFGPRKPGRLANTAVFGARSVPPSPFSTSGGMNGKKAAAKSKKAR